MKIAALKEDAAGEKRVSLTPDTVKKLVDLGADVLIETGAGEGSGLADHIYQDAGATIAADSAGALKDADIVLCVQSPSDAQLDAINENALLIGCLAPLDKDTDLQRYNSRNITSFTMELLPRISRAQAMDVLSSQSNLAGYRAVIDAVYEHGKVLPMMMTAAGTVPPAKVLVLGAGVAGLQAIATAKRLGAVVSAFDVRPAVKEQVQSLGAKFVEVEADEADGEDTGGYAKEMSEGYKKRQSELIAETVKSHDIVISTALIPGKPAPRLVTADMLQAMKPGSVLVDLAVATGGNIEGSKADKVATKHGCKIIGYQNMPSRCARDASPLYARNLFNYISTLMVDKESKALNVQWDDELIKGTLLTKEGSTVHPMLTNEESAA